MKFLPALLLALLSLPGHTAPATVTVEPGDKVILDKFLEHTHTGLAALTKDHFEKIKVPETICWLDCPQIQAGLTAYQLTGDAAFLNETATAIENLRAAVKKGPDGFRGWYGSPEASLADPAKPDAVISEIQTDFRVVGVVSQFLQLIGQEPEVSKAFAPHRQAWLDLIQNDLVKKWDSSFRDLGPSGAIYQWNKAYKPEKAGLTLSHEKMSIMINGLIRLYTITGDDEYMRKAVKLGTFLKHSLELNNGAYAWRFWNYGGLWDDNPGNPAVKMTWKEPKAQWYTATVGSAMQLYHHGFIFDDTDRDRFLKTQMTVCWNGDIANPVYFMTDGKPAAKGEVFASPALSPFNSKLYDLLYTGPAQAFRVQKSDNPWQGGILAADWLYGKYILNSPARKARPIDLALFNQFTHDKANAAWLKSISFTVQPAPPQSPAPASH